jgi:hypothetical protein
MAPDLTIQELKDTIKALEEKITIAQALSSVNDRLGKVEAGLSAIKYLVAATSTLYTGMILSLLYIVLKK